MAKKPAQNSDYINFDDNIKLFTPGQPIWRELTRSHQEYIIYVDDTEQYEPEAEYADLVGEFRWYVIKLNDDTIDDDRFLAYLPNGSYYYTTLDLAKRWSIDDTDPTEIMVPSDGKLVKQEFTTYQVRRFSLEQFKWVVRDGDRYLVSIAYENDYPHHPKEYQPWFFDSLDHVVDSAGVHINALTNALISDDPTARFWAYYSIGGYHGFDNFDSNPLILVEYDLDRRWDDA